MQVRKMNAFVGAMAMLVASGSALAQHGGAVKGAKAADYKGDPYTLGVCPVSGEELGDEVVVKEIDGTEVRFCCEDCVDSYLKNPEKYQKKIEAKVIAQQTPWYPMTTCVVSGEELKPSSMGDPIDYVYKNRLVRFCCAGCIKKFEKDPVKYLAKIDEQVIAQQQAHYPLKECVVSDESLSDSDMGGPIDRVFANRLVRFCCAGCVKKFTNDPAGYFAKIDEAYGDHSPAKMHGGKHHDDDDEGHADDHDEHGDHDVDHDGHESHEHGGHGG